MIGTKRLREFLCSRYGLQFDVASQRSNDGQLISIRPATERNHGFRIQMTLGWRSLCFSFTPEAYASSLVKTMGEAGADRRAVFSVYAESAADGGAPVRMSVNGCPVDPAKPQQWPENWENVEFSLRKGNLPLDRLDQGNSEKEAEIIHPWLTKFLGCPLALIPLEPVVPPASEAKREGGVIERCVRQYERSPQNRAACIELQGARCKVCDLDFGEKYGAELGGGFIHVHHIQPVSYMNGSYVLDPASDLIPVCPNCHAMLHKRNPPLSTDELLALLHRRTEAA